MGRLIDEDDVYITLTDYYHHRTDIQHAALREAISRVPSAQPEDKCGECDAWNQYKNYPRRSQWIPCSERLPEEAYPVIVTWKNDNPTSYYQYILSKHCVGVAHYKNGKWFWYSSTTEDVLMVYGRCDFEEFDEAIKVLAWMPLPEPWRG